VNPFTERELRGEPGAMVSSVRITERPNAHHAVISVWNRGALAAGSITVNASDADAIATRLLGGRAMKHQQSLDQMAERPNERPTGMRKRAVTIVRAPHPNAPRSWCSCCRGRADECIEMSTKNEANSVRLCFVCVGRIAEAAGLT
jgi:hypothetical protein